MHDDKKHAVTPTNLAVVEDSGFEFIEIYHKGGVLRDGFGERSNPYAVQVGAERLTEKTARPLAVTFVFYFPFGDRFVMDDGGLNVAQSEFYSKGIEVGIEKGIVEAVG